MFYKLIEKKRNEWLRSNECTVSELLKYIEQRGMMRDAQLEAIKTYLFLKIACGNYHPFSCNMQKLFAYVKKFSYLCTHFVCKVKDNR